MNLNKIFTWDERPSNNWFRPCCICIVTFEYYNLGLLILLIWTTRAGETYTPLAILLSWRRSIWNQFGFSISKETYTIVYNQLSLLDAWNLQFDIIWLFPYSYKHLICVGVLVDLNGRHPLSQLKVYFNDVSLWHRWHLFSPSFVTLWIYMEFYMLHRFNFFIFNGDFMEYVSVVVDAL